MKLTKFCAVIKHANLLQYYSMVPKACVEVSIQIINHYPKSLLQLL